MRGLFADVGRMLRRNPFLLFLWVLDKDDRPAVVERWAKKVPKEQEKEYVAQLWADTTERIRARTR